MPSIAMYNGISKEFTSPVLQILGRQKEQCGTSGLCCSDVATTHAPAQVSTLCR